MTIPSPDAAAFALQPPPLPPRPFGLRRIRGWLGQLADIGVQLADGVRILSVSRRINPTPTGRFEVDLARRLVARAMRWAEALRLRLNAEAKAARGAQEPRDSDYDPPEDLLNRRRRDVWEPAFAAEPDEGIGDRPAAEVIAQICADLGTAAMMTRAPRAAARIAEIGAAARALLGGPDEAWTPLPAVQSPAPEAGEPGFAVVPTAVSPPPSPNPLPRAGEGYQAPDSG